MDRWSPSWSLLWVITHKRTRNQDIHPILECSCPGCIYSRVTGLIITQELTLRAWAKRYSIHWTMDGWSLQKKFPVNISLYSHSYALGIRGRRLYCYTAPATLQYRWKSPDISRDFSKKPTFPSSWLNSKVKNIRSTISQGRRTGTKQSLTRWRVFCENNSDKLVVIG